MKKIMTCVLVILFASGAAAQTKWFSGSFDEAKTQAQKVNKQLMIFFTSGLT
jgi:flagellar basal body-associated protein FliL